VPVKMACQLVGIGNSTMWKYIKEGRVKTISLGRKRLVIYESLEQLVLGPTLEKILEKP
jgi:excisionase family DNA binding protein